MLLNVRLQFNFGLEKSLAKKNLNWTESYIPAQEDTQGMGRHGLSYPSESRS